MKYVFPFFLNAQMKKSIYESQPKRFQYLHCRGSSNLKMRTQVNYFDYNETKNILVGSVGGNIK